MHVLRLLGIGTALAWRAVSAQSSIVGGSLVRGDDALMTSKAHGPTATPVQTEAPQPPGPRLTFIVTSSLINTHPSTCVIDVVLTSLPKHFPIILALGSLPDGKSARDSERYAQYEAKLRKAVSGFSDMRVIRQPTARFSGRLTHNLRYAIQFVRTPFTCIVQHDLAFLEPNAIDFDAIVKDMQVKRLNLRYVLFSRFPDTLTHDLRWKMDRIDRSVGSIYRSIQSNISYAKTYTWSDNNHIASTRYLATLYKLCAGSPYCTRRVEGHCFPEFCMMQHILKFPGSALPNASSSDRRQLMGVRQEQYSWDNFGTWWYGPDRGQQVVHAQGRQSSTCQQVEEALDTPAGFGPGYARNPKGRKSTVAGPRTP
tara:strand:+ start:75 stop:1181 length:1107 start_codon:yes stop_codon:yes gene_type:complete